MIVSGFRAALDLDTYPLSNFICPRCAERAKPSRGTCKPVHIGFFALFSRHISRTQSFQRNRNILFLALVALKLLVSFIIRLVACSARIVADKQTNRQTDTQNDYCNPRCACVSRVNDLPRVGPEPTTLHSRQSALPLSYQGSSAGWAQISHLIVYT